MSNNREGSYRFNLRNRQSACERTSSSAGSERSSLPGSWPARWESSRFALIADGDVRAPSYASWAPEFLSHA
jgi:hypothetical protein